MKTLGILGGMGPYASLRFCELLLKQSIEKHGATRNADFPHFILSNLPVPDFIDDRSDEERAVAMVEQELKNLERAGADFTVVACNTMHIYQDRFQAATAIPFLSLRDEVIKSVVKDGHRRVGLLGSPTTLHSDLYVGPLTKQGIELVLPTAEEERELSACIQDLVGRGANDTSRSSLQRSIARLVARGAEAVILGCTELPLVKPEHPSIPVYDSLQILAEAACEQMYSSFSSFL